MCVNRFYVYNIFSFILMAEKDNNQVKEDLVENISELFLKYGLRSTSMDDICTHLKISKKTLYQFFTNKDDVVEQVMIHRRSNRQVRADLENLLRQNAICAMILIKNHIIADFSSRLPANLFDIKKYHPDVYERISAMDNEFINIMLRKLLTQGIQAGLFRENINQDVQTYLFINQMSFLDEPEMISNIIYPLDIIISTIIDNFVRSVSTPKGVTELEQLLKIIKNNEENDENNAKTMK